MLILFENWIFSLRGEIYKVKPKHKNKSSDTLHFNYEFMNFKNTFFLIWFFEKAEKQ
jgi:hypothetical protein